MRRKRWVALGLVFGQLVLGAMALVAAALLLRAEFRGAPSVKPDVPRAEKSLPSLEGDPAAVGWNPEASVVRYQMEARLDTEQHVVHGRARIKWRNTSEYDQEELYLHLYLNGFKNKRTVFMRSKAAEGFRGGGEPARWGQIVVSRFYVQQFDRDLWPPAPEAHTPGDAHDETDIRIALPESVHPGEELDIDVVWESRLPSIVLRTGYYERFHMVAQWYPKLARLEPDGRWAHFPFHRLSEFYADYGDYEVLIDVPRGFRVGATGVQDGAAELSEGRERRRFIARGVHDFAFAAWDGFLQLDDKGPGDVALRCLFPKGREGAARAELDVVKRGLAEFGASYGAYPYRALTVVHPPQGAREAGGMEYPMLITTGGRWFWRKLGLRAPELVTVHELGHQWFYGLVGTNEHRWPFLDEGVTSYVQTEAMEAWWPHRSAFHGLGFEVGLPAIHRAAAARVWSAGAIARSADAFPSGSDYVDLVYGRTATLLSTLARVHGKEGVVAAIGDYARTHRFGHPGPEALIGAIAKRLGSEVATVFRRGLFEQGWVDYAVESIHSKRGSGHRENGAENAAYRGHVRVRRSGTLRFPVEVLMVPAEGEAKRMVWDAVPRHADLPYLGDSPLVAAVIDPNQRVLLDHDLSNNALRQQPDRVATRVWRQSAMLVHAMMTVLFP